jgi:hypothetical protein
MISRWVIFEDVTDRALHITRAIRDIDHAVEIVWAACVKPFMPLSTDSVNDFRPLHTNIFDFSKRSEVLSFIEGLPKDATVFVTDIRLRGVHRGGDTWLADALAIYLERSLHSLVVVSSSQEAIPAFYQQFPENVRSRVIAGDLHDLPMLEVRQSAADSFIAKAHQDWNQRFGDELEKLWALTIDEGRWFRDGGVPHDVEGNMEAEDHRLAIKSIQFFEWCPDEWWTDLGSVTVLHENLKGLCGMTFCEGTRNLTVGATWLLAGAAWHTLARLRGESFSAGANPFCDGDPGFWARRPHSKRKVLPMQTPEHGKQCIRDLFAFFRQAFVFRSKSGTSAKDGKSSVCGASLEPPGSALQIIFNWQVDELVSRIEVGRNGLTSQGGSSGPLTAFLNQRQVGKKAIGARSSFWIQSNSLTIGGEEVQV